MMLSSDRSEDPIGPSDGMDRDGIAFHVRAFRPTDRPELEAFYQAFEPKRSAQGLPPEGASRISAWLDRILSRGMHLVAERDGDLIGHGFIMPTPDPDTGEYAIFLRRECRGRGIGTDLNRTMIEAARRAGIGKLWLTVQPTNRAAVRAYEKAGFRFVPATAFGPEPEMELRLDPT